MYLPVHSHNTCKIRYNIAITVSVLTSVDNRVHGDWVPNEEPFLWVQHTLYLISVGDSTQTDAWADSLNVETGTLKIQKSVV